MKYRLNRSWKSARSRYRRIHNPTPSLPGVPLLHVSWRWSVCPTKPYFVRVHGEHVGCFADPKEAGLAADAKVLSLDPNGLTNYINGIVNPLALVGYKWTADENRAYLESKKKNLSLKQILDAVNKAGSGRRTLDAIRGHSNIVSDKAKTGIEVSYRKPEWNDKNDGYLLLCLKKFGSHPEGMEAISEHMGYSPGTIRGRAMILYKRNGLGNFNSTNVKQQTDEWIAESWPECDWHVFNLELDLDGLSKKRWTLAPLDMEQHYPSYAYADQAERMVAHLSGPDCTVDDVVLTYVHTANKEALFAVKKSSSSRTVSEIQRAWNMLHVKKVYISCGCGRPISSSHQDAILDLWVQTSKTSKRKNNGRKRKINPASRRSHKRSKTED